MKTVLLIDDDQLLRQNIKIAIADDDIVVLEANDGQEGLELALKEHPDVIVLDENMPKLQGQQVLEKLRNDSWGEKVQVIAFTVNDDIALMNKKLQAGVTVYLDKSTTNPEQLAQLIRERIA